MMERKLNLVKSRLISKVQVFVYPSVVFDCRNL